MSKCDRGYAAIVEPHQVGQLAHRVYHLACLLDRNCQGLLTKDDLAGPGGRDRDRRVQNVWDRDVDDVNVASLDYRLPFLSGLLPAPTAREALELDLVTGAHDLGTENEWNIEKAPNLMECIRVGSGDKAASDHCDIQFAFGFRHALVIGM